MSFILNSEVLKRKIETTKSHYAPPTSLHYLWQGTSCFPWGYSKAKVWSLDPDLHIVKEVAGNTVLFLRMKLGWPYLVSKWYSRLGFMN